MYMFPFDSSAMTWKPSLRGGDDEASRATKFITQALIGLLLLFWLFLMLVIFCQPAKVTKGATDVNITLVGGNLTGPMVDNGTLLADNDNDTIVPAGQLNGSDVEAAAAAAAGSQPGNGGQQQKLFAAPSTLEVTKDMWPRGGRRQGRPANRHPYGWDPEDYEILIPLANTTSTTTAKPVNGGDGCNCAGAAPISDSPSGGKKEKRSVPAAATTTQGAGLEAATESNHIDDISNNYTAVDFVEESDDEVMSESGDQAITMMPDNQLPQEYSGSNNTMLLAALVAVEDDSNTSAVGDAVFAF